MSPIQKKVKTFSFILIPKLDTIFAWKYIVSFVVIRCRSTLCEQSIYSTFFPKVVFLTRDPGNERS